MKCTPITHLQMLGAPVQLPNPSCPSRSGLKRVARDEARLLRSAARSHLGEEEAQLLRSGIRLDRNVRNAQL